MSDPLDDNRDPDESQETVLTDLRTHARKRLVVEVGLHTSHRFWSGWTENISEGGVFIATEDLLSVGEQVVLNLKLEGHRGARAFPCEVRWVRDEADEGIPVGLGLHFLELDPAEAERIQQYIQTEDLDVLVWDRGELG